MDNIKDCPQDETVAKPSFVKLVLSTVALAVFVLLVLLIVVAVFSGGLALAILVNLFITGVLAYLFSIVINFLITVVSMTPVLMADKLDESYFIDQAELPRVIKRKLAVNIACYGTCLALVFLIIRPL
jgi:hypothetical protein